MTEAASKLERAFWQFHSDNPTIYRLLVRYAREWARFHDHCSIKLLFERVRWQVAVETRAGDGFKLNNNHAPYYARLLEHQEADLAGLFRLRQQRQQCTFGPRNAGLPPGDHIA
jgi:hypothetical protein